MKIAFFSNCYLPYLSGITVSIKTFREGLEKLGHQVFVVAPKYPGHKETDQQVLSLPSVAAPYPGYRIVLPFSHSVYQRLEEEKIDIIHTHQSFEVGQAALWFARKHKIPLVYSYHTLFTRYIQNAGFLPQKPARFILARYLAHFCNQTSTVVVPSKMVRRLLVSRKVKTPIETIPTGINLEEIIKKAEKGKQKAELRKELGLPVSAKLLLCSGRISAEKNITTLLHYFAAIAEQAENTYLVVVGGGPKEEEYRKLAKSIHPKIIFAGQQPHNVVLDYCFAADLFVYTSTTETQGLVLNEAKACGLPVVALFGGGIADVIENGVDGFLLPKNEAAFVKHVLLLLNNEELRQKMSEKAKQDSQTRFASDVVAKKLETVYNLLSNKR